MNDRKSIGKKLFYVVLALLILIINTNILPFRNDQMHRAVAQVDPDSLSQRYVVFLGGIRSSSSDSSPIGETMFKEIKDKIGEDIGTDRLIYFSYSAVMYKPLYCIGWGSDNCTDDYNFDMIDLKKVPIYSIPDTQQSIVEQASALDWLLRQIIKKDPNAKIDIVGFSLGGIVSSYWATHQGISSTARPHIHSIVMIGSPVGGLPLADAFVEGCDLLYFDCHSWRLVLGYLYGETVAKQLQVTPDSQDSIVASLRDAPRYFNIVSIQSIDDYTVNGRSIPVCDNILCQNPYQLLIGNGSQYWPMHRHYFDSVLGGSGLITEPVYNVELFNIFGGIVSDNHNASVHHAQTAIWVVDAIRDNPVAGEPVDVVLIIDSSGSMLTNDRYNKRLDAARAYLLASLGGDYVGVVDFDSYARLASSLLRLPENRLTLENAINTIDSSGGTNIGVGIQVGCNALISSSSNNTKKAGILLTDGVGSFSGQDSCFKDRGWPIYTFGFGSANDTLLTNIATNTGGEYQRLPTSNLVCEFQRVRAKIAGANPGPCMDNWVDPNTSTIFLATVPPGQSQATFSTSWLGSDVMMTLTTPSGIVINRNNLTPDINYSKGPAYEVISIPNPEAGDWIVDLFGLDVPPGGEPVVFNMITIPSSAPPNQPPVLSDIGEQTVQYSDAVAISVTATDPDDVNTSLIFSAAGLPGDLQLVNNGDGTATISGFVSIAPGTYIAEITVSDPAGDIDSEVVQFVVHPEDARVTYTGSMLVSTSCADCSAAVVPLRATVQDITAVLDDPDYDAFPGNITNATVSFVNRENSDAVLCTASVVLLDPLDGTTGTAACDWTVDIGISAGLDYTVGVVVDGYYTRNSTEDDTVVVVSKPTSNFITGGGYLLNNSSGGTFAGDPELKSNFGMNIKFTKKLTALQGRVTLIVHQGGHTYQIKTNALSSLVAIPFDQNNPQSGTAELIAKANVTDVTDPLVPIELFGNATMQVRMKDNGEPGSADLLSITLWGKNNELLFSSNWDGVQTVPQALDGGNLRVH